MTTQLSQAKDGIITPQMEQVAKYEGISPEKIKELVVQGKVVIPYNKHRNFYAVGIGENLRTKINANIGASNLKNLEEEEIEKLNIATKFGADAVMDLSTGGDLDEIRKTIIKNSPVMVGTVPIYELATKYEAENFDSDKLYEVIEKQARQGVDFITVHCGITKQTLPFL
ncbi:MAG: phosphomethylpyrimidine synthase ThiC, partial [Myxococcota bacterium]